ncbi:MAG: VWA domain-containing protein, partial [Gemmatimonadota bacterium]
MNFEFLRGELLLMVALLPIWWFATRPNWRSGVLFPRSAPAPMLRSRRGKTIVLAAVPRLLRGAAQASLIFVLAGPILVYQIDAVEREELAMVLAVDLSSSMLAQDMEEGKTRMEVARETAVRFIRGRATDRVGLVAFAGEAL